MSLTGTKQPWRSTPQVFWCLLLIAFLKKSLTEYWLFLYYLQVHPHSCCLWRPLYRRTVCHGWLPWSHWFGYGNPLGGDHHLPVLWDLCEGAEWSGQHGSTALLENANLATHIRHRASTLHKSYVLHFFAIRTISTFYSWDRSFLLRRLLFSTISLSHINAEKTVLVTPRVEHSIVSSVLLFQ